MRHVVQLPLRRSGRGWSDHFADEGASFGELQSQMARSLASFRLCCPDIFSLQLWRGFCVWLALQEHMLLFCHPPLGTELPDRCPFWWGLSLSTFSKDWKSVLKHVARNSRIFAQGGQSTGDETAKMMESFPNLHQRRLQCLVHHKWRYV